MGIYKITNITSLIGKRELKFNSTLDIEYIDNMDKKVIKLLPNDSCYLTVGSIPVSVQRLAIKNLIAVSEITADELKKQYEMSIQEKIVDVITNKSSNVVKANHLQKKRTGKKEDEEN